MTKNIVKKRNSTFKLIASLALVLLMSISLIIPASAYPDWDTRDPGTPTNWAKAAVTKLLEVPIDTPVPSAKFEFTAVAKGMWVNGTLVAGSTGMPTIEIEDIEYSKTNPPTTDIFTDPVASNNRMWYVKETPDFLYGGGLRSVDWVNGAGIYVYDVTETASWTFGENTPTHIQEFKSDSKAQYRVEIWVSEHVHEDGTIEYYVSYINAKLVGGLIDVYYPGGKDGDKVDPTPGEWRTEKDDTIEKGYSQMIFTNKYWYTEGKGPTEPNKGALEIIKTTTGAGADPAASFTFTVRVTQPSVIPIDEPQSYAAYIVEGGNIVAGSNVTFASGVSQTVSLKSGQKLVFTDLHIGADVEVVESAAEGYQARYKRTFSGDSVAIATAPNMSWGFGGLTGANNTADLGNHFLTSNVTNGAPHKVDFTNTSRDQIPTGLDVDDLPYIVLIGVAVAGLAAFIVIKSRKRTENDA